MSTFRLTIWKPFRSDRAVRYAWDTGTEDSVSFDARKLQEMIYSWAPEENVLSGIADEALLTDLRTRLFEDFSEGLPPQERGFAKLRQLLDFLERLQAKPEALQWTSTSQTADPAHWKPDMRNSGEDTSSTLRCAPTIALYQQLLWLADVFGEMPELSIIIR